MTDVSVKTLCLSFLITYSFYFSSLLGEEQITDDFLSVIWFWGFMGKY